jgi:BASS family bile acid:Na+ symporter
MSVGMLLAMSGVSLVCCAFNFAAGRYIGGKYRPRLLLQGRSRSISEESVLDGKAVRKVTAGQSLGQKNTIFAIWLAYTFMTPETAIIGGLYSLWHNIYNSWQLRKAGK